jgi:hypothetical protein
MELSFLTIVKMIVAVAIVFCLDKYTSEKERGFGGRIFFGFLKLLGILFFINIFPEWVPTSILVAAILFGIYGLLFKNKD